ncbi:thiamine phosphate synthase [Thalassobacillus hwangdonensis]|uniref:Thiamine-phosphate synthase n=1 Tax=Thalassobacillus hwangdonensis TaxID=546108 RepID=A0ABW3L3W3_9BACI
MSKDLYSKLRKYFVMGSQNCDRDSCEVLEEAVRAGITAFQYREKGQGSLEGAEKLALGRKLREICRKHGILFFVNDDVELVDPLEADGIHVGQDDLSAEELRRRFPDRIIGLSISNLAELERSPIEVVDYVGVGPMFATTTKEDAKKPVDVHFLEKVKHVYPDLPTVGIGGINETNAADVLEAGADGVAVISVITKSDDILRTVQNL